MCADIADGILLLRFDFSLGFAEQSCSLVLGFLLSFRYDGVASLAGFLKDLCLLLTCLLQNGLTFFLYVGQLLVGFVGFLQGTPCGRSPS